MAAGGAAGAAVAETPDTETRAALWPTSYDMTLQSAGGGAAMVSSPSPRATVYLNAMMNPNRVNPARRRRPAGPDHRGYRNVKISATRMVRSGSTTERTVSPDDAAWTCS